MQYSLLRQVPATREPCDEGTNAPSTRAWTSLVPARRANQNKTSKLTKQYFMYKPIDTRNVIVA